MVPCTATLLAPVQYAAPKPASTTTSTAGISHHRGTRLMPLPGGVTSESCISHAMVPQYLLGPFHGGRLLFCQGVELSLMVLHLRRLVLSENVIRFPGTAARVLAVNLQEGNTYLVFLGSARLKAPRTLPSQLPDHFRPGNSPNPAGRSNTRGRAP